MNFFQEITYSIRLLLNRKISIHTFVAHAKLNLQTHRYRMVSVISLIFVSLAISFAAFQCRSQEPVVTVNNTLRNTIKTDVPQNMDYSERVDEPLFYNLHMLGNVNRNGVTGQRMYGMVLRSLRFQNITRKIERKYKLPENILLAMVMQESGGVDLLPNSSDDGGLGLCHMQPYMANLFGLQTLNNCKEMVSKKHGKELRELIQKNNYDRKKLIVYDDRFHPILNLDAAARMLAYYMNGKQYQNTPIKTAIFGYAGKYNYNKYYKNVMFYRDKLNDKGFLKELENEFNKKNPNLMVDNKHGDFDAYIKAHQRQNINYGLRKYK